MKKEKLKFISVIAAVLILVIIQTGCKKSNSYNTTIDVPGGYTVKVNNESVPTYGCRVSAVPLNQVWAGYQRPTSQTEIGAFAYWDMKGGAPSTVEITSERTVNSVKISPASSGIVATVEGNKIRFTVDRPRQIVVEVNGTHPALHLFANPEATDVPEAIAPNIRYFGPGEHNVGRVKLQSNETVYIAPGATVFGSFYAINANNIRIYGRGILDAGKLDRGMGSIAGFSGCANVTIDGIVLRNPSMWCCTFFGCSNVNVNNIKLVGLWRYNADGIDVVNCQNVAVKDCFIRSFDDALVVKGMKSNLGEPEYFAIGSQPVLNVTFTGCVIWCDWGHAMEIGAETSAPYIDGVTFKDCDIIRTAHAAMDIQHGDGAPVRNVLYENIRFQIDSHTPEPVTQQTRDEVYADPNRGYVPALMQLRIQKTMFSQDELLGTIDNVVFKDISVTGSGRPPSMFFGADARHRVSGVTIDNLRFNGQHILNAQQAGLETGNFVNDVTFR